MAKKPTLRELQEAYFQDRTKFFNELSSSQQAYQDIMQRGAAKRQKLQKDMEDALAAVDQETQREAEESKLRLSQLIPIDPNESPPPTMRAAYSDRMSALLAKLAFFAYIRFETPGNLEILQRVLTDGGMELKKTYNVLNTEAYMAEAPDFVVVASGISEALVTTAGGIAVVDISNPHAPSLVVDFDLASDMNSLVLRDQMVYVAGRHPITSEAGVQYVIDVSLPAQPVVLQMISVPVPAVSCVM